MRASPPATSTSSYFRTLVSVQVLSVSICFFCTAYLVLSIYYPLFLQNIVSGLNFQPELKNDNIPLHITKLVTDINQQSITKTSNESFICDNVKPINQHNQTSSASFEKHRLNALRRKDSAFCLAL
jgi:hypothetical protein